MGIEQETCGGCERSMYTYDACRRCGEVVCYKCWEMRACACEGVPRGRPSEQEIIREWLERMLRWRWNGRKGPIRVEILMAGAAKYGWSKRAVIRAKEALALKSVRIGTRWGWELPVGFLASLKGGDEHLDAPMPGEGDHGEC